MTRAGRCDTIGTAQDGATCFEWGKIIKLQKSWQPDSNLTFAKNLPLD
nr:MAG TPA: conotoxin [Caudoviricetes sp.]